MQKKIFAALSTVGLALGMFLGGYLQASAVFGDLVWTVAAPREASLTNGAPYYSTSCASAAQPYFQGTPCRIQTTPFLSSGNGGEFFSAAAADAGGLYTGRRWSNGWADNSPWIQKWSPNGSLLLTVPQPINSAVMHIANDGTNIRVYYANGTWEVRRKSDLGLVSVSTGANPPYSAPNWSLGELESNSDMKLRAYDAYSRRTIYLSDDYGQANLNFGASISGSPTLTFTVPKTKWMMSSAGEAPTTAFNWYGPEVVAPDGTGYFYVVGGSGTYGSIIEKREAPPEFVVPSQPKTVDLFANPLSVAYNNTTTIFWNSTGGATSCTAMLGGPSGFSTGGATGGFDVTLPLTASTPFMVTCSFPDGTTMSDSENVTVTGVPLFPDLVATQAQANPPTVTVGTPITFSATIQNNGDASTGASFQNFFQLASGPGGTGTINNYTSGMLTPATMSALAVGASAPVSLSVSAFTTPGTYSGRFCADKTQPASVGVIDEGTREGNNCGAPWRDVIVTAPSTATVSLSPVSQSMMTGSTVSFQVNMNLAGTPTDGGIFRINYDTSRLSNPNFTYATGLPVTPWTPGPSYSTPGTISAVGFDANGFSGSVMLGTLTFQATNTGTANVTTLAETNPAWRFLDNIQWNEIPVTYSGATVTVTAPVVPTAQLFVSDPNVSYGDTVSLLWTSTNANSCVATSGPGFSTSNAVNGSDTSNTLTTTATFAITCTGPGGSASDSKTVTVSPPAGPTIQNLSATNCTIAANASTCPGTVSWNITGATNPNTYNATRSASCGTGPSGTLSCTLSRGNNTIQGRDGTTALSPSVVATATCTSGTSWNGTQCAPITTAECNDNGDNDGDDLIDWDGNGNPALVDPGCTSATDTDETDTTPATQCSDNIDNDGDGYTDFDGNGTPADADPGCTSATDTSEFNIGSIRPR